MADEAVLVDAFVVGKVRGMASGRVRPIRYLGDPILRTESDPVRQFDERLAQLVVDMFASMYAAEGVGLAANQIGVAQQVFVYDCKDDEGRRFVGHVVNPVLMAEDGGMVTADEGCLSLPGLYFKTPRHAHAVVEGFDQDGKPVRIEGTGNFARCLQHESYHLRGNVYIDVLKGETRKEALRAIRTTTWAKA